MIFCRLCFINSFVVKTVFENPKIAKRLMSRDPCILKILLHPILKILSAQMS